MKRSKAITLVFLGIALTACGQEPEVKKDGFWTAGDDMTPPRNEGSQPTFTNPPPQVAQKKEDGSSSIMPFFMGYLLSSAINNNNSSYNNTYTPRSYPSISPRKEEEERRRSGSTFAYVHSGSGYSGGSATAMGSRNFLNNSNNRIVTNTPLTRPSSLPAPVRASSVPSVPRASAPITATSRGGFGSTAVSSAAS